MAAATNLPPEYFNPAKVVALYAKRMQIEETFRDFKSPQYGMGLRQSRSRCPKRYDVLLLIAMLAEILLWCIGIAARHLGWQKDFQANSIKHRAVLSVVRLGKEVRRRPKYTPHPVKKVVDNLLGIKRIYQTDSCRWKA